MRPAASTYDPVVARTAAVNYALLMLVLRPVGSTSLSERQFETLALVVAVVLARAECRAGGRR